MNKLIEPVVYIAAFAALSYYAYRMIKNGLEEPEPHYEPASYEAALFLDASPNYDYELPLD